MEKFIFNKKCDNVVMIDSPRIFQVGSNYFVEDTIVFKYKKFRSFKSFASAMKKYNEIIGAYKNEK